MKEFQLHTDLDTIKELTNVIGQQADTIKELQQRIEEYDSTVNVLNNMDREQTKIIQIMMEKFKEYPDDISKRLFNDFNDVVSIIVEERNKAKEDIPF